MTPSKDFQVLLSCSVRIHYLSPVFPMSFFHRVISIFLLLIASHGSHSVSLVVLGLPVLHIIRPAHLQFFLLMRALAFSIIKFACFLFLGVTPISLLSISGDASVRQHSTFFENIPELLQMHIVCVPGNESLDGNEAAQAAGSAYVRRVITRKGTLFSAIETEPLLRSSGVLALNRQCTNKFTLLTRRQIEKKAPF